jgi:hypothetical protein
MRVEPGTIRLMVAGLTLLAASAVHAQRTTYRCTVDGRQTLSDRPCETRASTSLTVVGPLRDRPQTMSSEPTTRRAAEYLDYLSPHCSELNEGLRNGPARGLGSRALDELRRSYNELCRDDDQQARRRFAEEQASRREIRAQDQAAERRERDQKRLSIEQCDEMYRILHGKRPKLPTMSPGERADFHRFEANWQARCKPG